MLREKNKIFERIGIIPEIKTRKLIAKGGFYEVYQISDDIATKILLGSRKENVERFKREIDFIEQVNHPNIIRIIDKSMKIGRAHV